MLEEISLYLYSMLIILIIISIYFINYSKNRYIQEHRKGLTVLPVILLFLLFLLFFMFNTDTAEDLIGATTYFLVIVLGIGLLTKNFKNNNKSQFIVYILFYLVLLFGFNKINIYLISPLNFTWLIIGIFISNIRYVIDKSKHIDMMIIANVIGILLTLILAPLL